MIELQVKDLKNKVVGKESGDEAIFKAGNKPYLLHEYVLMQRRALRQGTHSTKTRAEVSGTGKKPFRQKGTGHARQGTLIGPHQPGGGIQFGPKPRDYSTGLTRKTKAEALRVALSQKQFEGKLAVIDSFDIKSGKTKDVAAILKAYNTKSILVVGEFSDNTRRAVRNMQNVKALLAEGLNVFDLLKHEQVLVTKSALKTLSTKLAKKTKAKKEKAA